MTSPIPFQGPATGDTAASVPPAPRGGWREAVAVSFAVVGGTALLGAAAGFIWTVVAPRASLVMVTHGAASLVHPESDVFIAADAWFSLIMVVGGAISGAAGYRLAVRRHGPVAMAGVLIGGVAAAFVARWTGEQADRATFHHLLATLPAGAHLRDALMLGASGALAFWALAAGLVAGGLAVLAARRSRRAPGQHPGPGSGGTGPPAASPVSPGPG